MVGNHTISEVALGKVVKTRRLDKGGRGGGVEKDPHHRKREGTFTSPKGRKKDLGPGSLFGGGHVLFRKVLAPKKRRKKRAWSAGKSPVPGEKGNRYKARLYHRGERIPV